MQLYAYSSEKTYLDYNISSVYIPNKVQALTLTASKGFVAMLDVKVDDVGHFWSLAGIDRLCTEDSSQSDNDERERKPAKHDDSGGIRRRRDVEQQTWRP